MTSTRISVSAIALAAISVLASSRAASAQETPDARTCSAEEGQRIRASGKLKEAGTFYLTCRDQCAPAARRVCEAGAQEVLALEPTILIDARDRRRNTVTDVAVTIDGKVVATELDGKAIGVDPGKHTIMLTLKGGSTVTQDFVATEGVKGLPINAEFVGGSKDPDAMARDIGGHTVWPWAVVAVGIAGAIAGVAIVATAPKLPNGCNKDTKVCEPDAGEKTNSTSFTQRRDLAGQAADQPKVGVGVIVLGGLIAAGGLVWHFIEPTEPRGESDRPKGTTVPASTGPRSRMKPVKHVAPWFSTDGAGVAATGTF